MLLFPGICGAFTFVDVQSASGILYDQNDGSITSVGVVKRAGTPVLPRGG
jgi:hypothetical protein